MIYIYKITNQINGKIYVGQTRFAVTTRLAQHAKCDSVIGRAIRQFGIENFSVEIVDVVSDRDADAVETELIDRLGSRVPNGYNVAPGAYYPRHKKR